MKLLLGSCVVLVGFMLSTMLAQGADAQPVSVPEPREVIGPLVGHVTDSQANLWIWSRKSEGFQLSYWHSGQTGAGSKNLMVPGRSQENGVARAKLSGLSPSTTCQYQFSLDGQENPLWRGSFTTAPASGTPTRFTMAVSSCMKPDHPNQSSWYLLLAQRPTFHLLLGDSVYTDTTDHEKIWQGHILQRSVPEFATVMRNMPNYAMWDDHDYGPNNSDGTAEGKENSLRAFQEIWANPAAGTAEVPGAFFQFSWGDVDFFILDGRYHRSPDDAPNDERKRMLGDKQFSWLAQGLKASKAKFKILASGSTLKASKSDGWLLYDFSRKRLFQLIAENKIGGAIYLSGDIHRSIVQLHPRSETGGYDLCEVISSGIANSETRSFATLTFDTTLDEPTVRVRILHGDGSVRYDKTLKLSELQVP